MRKIVFALVVVGGLICAFSMAHAARKSGAAAAVSAHLPPAAVSALQKIDPEHIRAHVRFLSHDLLEGRGTGQRGGDIAAEYIATEFWLNGLKAAGDNGTFFQQVSFVGITPTPDCRSSGCPGSQSEGQARRHRAAAADWGLRRPEAGSTPGTPAVVPSREVIPGLFQSRASLDFGLRRWLQSGSKESGLLVGLRRLP